MSGANHVIEVEDSTFDQEVLQRSLSTPVLVDFWAAWCAPCKALTPVLTRLAEDYAGAVVLAKVNTDENQQLAQQCGIRSLPTVLLVKDGQIVDGFVGAQPDNAIRALLEKHQIVPLTAVQDETPPPRPLDAADRKQVIAELRAAIKQKPDEYVLYTQLAELLIAEADYAEAEAILKQLPEDKRQGGDVARLQALIRIGTAVAGGPVPEILSQRLTEQPADSEAQYLLGLNKALAGDHEGALETLLTLVRRDRKFGEDAARKAMLDVFTLLGGSGPLVKQYRSMLYSALN